MTEPQDPALRTTSEPSSTRRRRRRPEELEPEPSRPGRRTQRRREQRRRTILRGLVGGFAVVSIGMAVAWVVVTFGGDGAPSDGPTAVATENPSDEPVDAQAAWVVATFDEAGSGRADLVSILAHDRESGEATIIFVPTTLLAEVPGQGLQDLGEAFAIGGAPLLEVTLANVLGIDFDGALGVSRQDWSALFTRVGGVTLDVPTQVTSTTSTGTTQVRFRPGEQVLDGPRAAEYLTIVEDGEAELNRFPRVQQVLEELFRVLGTDPTAMDVLFEDGAPMLDIATPQVLRSLFEDIAAAQAAGDLQLRSLPVVSVGSGDEQAYRPETERVEALVEDQLSNSRPDGSATVGRRVQVLNGNGIPGIGQAVAELLQPGGFRIIDSGNHANFDEPRTRILVFNDDVDIVAAAEEARALLGVGSIALSEVPLGVADIVIIVGADFTG